MSLQDISAPAYVADDKGRAKKKNFSSFDIKNYVNTRLEPEQTEKEFDIRILPIEAGSNSYYKIVYQHNVRVDEKVSASGWKNYICCNETEDLNVDGVEKKCPLCEMSWDSYNHYKPYKEKFAQGYKRNDFTQEQLDDCDKWHDKWTSSLPHKACIIRCIVRGCENEGPKFWKFNVSDANLDDPLHKIEVIRKNCQKYGIDPVSIFNGKDLTVKIEVGHDRNGNRSKGTNITIMASEIVTPLGTQEEMERWVNDPKKWTDVFAVKSYDYLKIIADGKVPYFNKETQQWVESGYNANVAQTPNMNAIENNLNSATNSNYTAYPSNNSGVNMYQQQGQELSQSPYGTAYYMEPQNPIDTNSNNTNLPF